jgi:hypothetical protein
MLPGSDATVPAACRDVAARLAGAFVAAKATPEATAIVPTADTPAAATVIFDGRR